MASINVNNLPAKAAAAITTADQVMTFTASGDTTQTPFNEAVAQANSLNLISEIKTVKLHIPSANVLTLASVPISFGITAPVGYYAVGLSCQIKATYATTAYATATIIKIGSSTGSIAMFSGNLLNFTANTFVSIPIVSGVKDEEQYDNGNDFIAAVQGGSDPTAGDSDIDIYLTYTLIEL